MEEVKEIQTKETQHDVKIAVIANEIKHISKGIDDMRGEIKSLSNSFIKSSDFESWKKQEYDELKKNVDTHGTILLKHTLSITRIMTYGTALISFIGVIQIIINIYDKVK